MAIKSQLLLYKKNARKFPAHSTLCQIPGWVVAESCVEDDLPYPKRIGQFCYPVDRVAFVDMATAIVRIYISDGFVVAADGREVDAMTKAVVSNCEQKIFALHHHYGNMACAVTGAGRIGNNYRLSEEIPRIAANLADCEALSVVEYAEYLANDLKRSIEKRFSSLKKTFAINLLLDGFIDQEPGQAKAVITCGPHSVPVRVESQELFPGKSIGFGSRLIHESLFAPTLRYEILRPYWNTCQQELRSIEQSIAVADAIIAAQCDQQVIVLDIKHNASIGGHIHIAKITPASPSSSRLRSRAS